MPIVLNFENLSLLETSEPVQACNGIALTYNMNETRNKIKIVYIVHTPKNELFIKLGKV